MLGLVPGGAEARIRLSRIAAEHGLELVGVTSAAPLPADRERMEASFAAGRMATMGWMGGQRAAIATDPVRLEPRARSVIVVAAPYTGPRRAAWDTDTDALTRALAAVLEAGPATPVGRVARYARGGDYHVTLRRRLEAMAAALRREGVDSGDVVYVDDRPLAERALAERAGLGWIGKNTNLLVHRPTGSWVFIGTILTSANLVADEPVRSHCGSCTRCLSGCPTGALVEARTIDARRCISYLTIEHPGSFEDWEAAAIGDWIFGCDICQEVCPVNAGVPDDGPLPVPLLPLIDWLLGLGSRAFGRAVARTALTRAGRHRLLRNALAALGNAGVPDGAWPLVERAASDRRSEVRAAAEALLGRRR